MDSIWAVAVGLPSGAGQPAAAVDAAAAGVAVAVAIAIGAVGLVALAATAVCSPLTFVLGEGSRMVKRDWSQLGMRDMLRCFAQDLREDTRMLTLRATGRNAATDMSLVVAVSGCCSAPSKKREARDLSS